MLGLVVFSIAVAGCHIHKQVEISLPIPVKEVEKIPLRVALYLDSSLTYYSKGPGGGQYTLKMGEAFSKGAEYIGNKAFREVITVETKDPEKIPKGFDALIILEVDRIYGGVPNERSRLALVKIVWTIQDMNGKLLYRNSFGAEAYMSIPFTSSKASGAYAKAIEEQFTKAFVGITSVKWWESIKTETDQPK